MGGGTARSFDLDSIGVVEVIGATKEILAYEIADVAGREGDAIWPTVTLDPCIDYEWWSQLGSRAVETAAGAFWEAGSPGTPEGVIDLVREDLAEAIATSAEDWRIDTIERLAQGLVDRYPELIGADSPYSEPWHLIAELEERLGLRVDTSAVDGIVDRCSSKVTLFVGSRSDFDNDWGPSRRVLRSAAAWLDGPQETAWEPEADQTLADDCAKCSAQWLCETQGTTLAEVVNGRDGGFAESLRDAIVEDVGDSWGWPMIGVLTTLGLNDIATANTALEWQTPRGIEKPFAAIPTGRTAQGYSRQPNVVLTDPVNGSGQCVRIELERPLEIDLGDICCAMRDGVGGKWGNWYTSQEIGGWFPSEFERTLWRPVPANEIDKEPMIGKPMGMKLR